MARDLDDVLRQMAAHGVRPPEGTDLDKAFRTYVRFRPDGEKRAKKSGWVRLFEYTSPTTKRVYVTGAYGWRGDTWQVEASDVDWSPAERAQWVEARKAAAKVADAERAKEGETAAAKAQRMWDRATILANGTLDGHDYIRRKQVGAYGLRRGFNQRLLVPLCNVRGELQGLQYIAPDGDKLFGTGTIKEGRSHLLGAIRPGLPLLAFGEGYATCASVHMAMDWPVVCCFDAGNLLPVMQEYRRLYPTTPFVVLADDDRHLLPRLAERLARHSIQCTVDELRESMDREWRIPDGPDVVLVAGWKGDGTGVMRIEGTLTVAGHEQQLVLENAGQAKAHAAARKCNARVITPYFVDRASPATDWNDLHCSAGLDAVRSQITAAMDAPPEKPRANARAQRAGKGGADGRKPGRGDRGGQGGAGSDGDMSFLERFTLIYGTTTVWDSKVRDILKVESLKLAYGKAIDWWLADPDRRLVTQDRVVFDPTGASQPPEFVNLFDRLPLTPVHDPDACDLITEHVYNLCQRDLDLYHWVMAWLAFPFQHPGAKMRTALVLHGRTEGTGKSKLGEIMRRLYGRYCTSVGQAELQRDFNEWLSARLLVLAEEVVSRQDRAHHQGMLQALITQPTVQINQKNMPVREEANHANFIFFSNQQVPVLLNPTDRRFCVIKVEQVYPPEYFAAIDHQLDNGGAEAFLDYLLTYDLRGFNQYTRPPETRDRMHLITLGMSPDQRFFQFLRMGFVGVPFCSCAAADLYVAFKAWCRLNGERFVPTATAFGRTVTEQLELMQCPEKKVKRYESYSDKCISEGDFGDDVRGLQTTKQGVVYFVPEHLEAYMPRVDGDERAAPPDGPVPNVTEASHYNARIKLFQVALHDLLSSAKRAM